MEKNLSISLNEAYKNVKLLALAKNCKIVYDEPYKMLILIHGHYTLLPSLNIKKILRIKFLENKIFVNYEVPKSIKITDVIVFCCLLILLIVSYFYFSFFIAEIQRTLPQIPSNSPFGETESLLGMLKLIEVLIILGIIFIFLLLPLNFIKYRMAKRFVREFLSYI